MKVKPQTKEFVRPLRSGSKVQQNMKLPGTPPEKIPKISHQVDDLSLLKKSVDTSVTNPLEILKVFQRGTPEIIETMKNECSMIYECKVCRNLFRSIANFITHKRNYCTTKFSPPSPEDSNGDVREHALVVGGGRGSVSTSRKTTRRDILSLLDNLQERFPEAKSHVFTEIPHTGAAVYNTTHAAPMSFKDESNDGTVVLGPNGRIIGSTQDGGETTECKSCGESIRHMESHLSICNSAFRQYFGCPLCGKYFTTAWAVYRHLKKFHGKNTEQVKKLRSLITKQDLPVETKYKRQSIVKPASTPSGSEKGWLAELEKNGADGLYKCYICGKQFERRVALISHTAACEKRKPGAVAETKKPGNPLRENSTDKASPAAIQMRVCYKKDGVIDKLTDCRVIATRLSDEDTLAALSPKAQNNEPSSIVDKNNSLVNKVISHASQNSNEPQRLKNGINIESDNEEIESSETYPNESEVDRSEMENINDRDEFRSSEMNSEVDVNNDSDFREDPFHEDMYVTPSRNCYGLSRDGDETASNSVLAEDNSINIQRSMTNGFLSSSEEDNRKEKKGAVCPSPDKPCNGWKEPEANPIKDHFYSTFVNSSESILFGDNAPIDSLGTSLSNDEDEYVEDCDFDSLEVTRIICGSVKPVTHESDDETGDEPEDSCTVNSEKPTPSVSTEMSFDLEVVELDGATESESESDDISDTLDPYVSKTDSICLICYNKIIDTRQASNHVAEHLGIKRFACGVPSCTVKTFSRLKMIQHIRKDHLLESSSLVKTLNAEEMFTEDNSDFLGFDMDKNQLYSAYSEFLGVLLNSHGISLNEDD